MSWIDQGLHFYLGRRANKLREASFDPKPSQEAAFKKLKLRIGPTGVSKKMGFDKVSSTEDMRQIPVSDYLTIESEVKTAAQIGNKAKNLFGSSKLVSLAATSGTTAEPKRIPINKDYMAAYKRFTLSMNACYNATDKTVNPLTQGKLLVLTARPYVGSTPGGLPEGFISGFMAARAPFWYRFRVLPSKDILCLSTWEEKMDKVLDQARGQKIDSIGAVPALALTFTERALAKFNAKNLREIWPSFHGLLYSGVALSPTDRLRFDKLWGATPENPINYWEMYAATEAQIGHTYDRTWPGMIFNPFENFYQFLEDGKGPVRQLHELEAGKKYAILITTPGGLINYRIGDWVEITSVNPLTFKIAGRDKDEISLATEKLNLYQLQSAIADVSKMMKTPIEEFVFWPKEGSPHNLICGLPANTVKDLKKLSSLLDEALGQKNPSYQEMRINDMIYGPVQIEELPSEVFKSYRLKNLDRGQFKQKQVFKNEASFKKEYSI